MIRTPCHFLAAVSAMAIAAPAIAQQSPSVPPPAEPATSEADESASAVRFSGAPEITAPGGWSFKPFGRLQFDAGHVSRPDGITDPGLGFSSELRRARIGLQGDMPGGFGYKFELDFAGGDVEITDAILTFEASDAVGLTLGQHNGFQSLEELTSSRFSSFVERAAFTDAFGFERRVGASMEWKKGDFLAQAGIFTENVEEMDAAEDSAVGIDARIVHSSRLGDVQLHLGASGHWRDKGDPASVGTTRYRQRPLIHSTDVRFLATPALPVGSETHYGLEFAAVRGPFHAAAEAHWLEPDLVGAVPDPIWFGGYAEVGWFLTGESRGYKDGRFDRTRVRRPVEAGGLGALQVNLRYDRIDLNDGSIRGGAQNGLQASLIWIPTDHVRFLINYARLSYDEAAIPAAGGDRDYAVDVIGARAQIDF